MKRMMCERQKQQLMGRLNKMRGLWRMRGLRMRMRGMWKMWSMRMRGMWKMCRMRGMKRMTWERRRQK